MSIRKVSRLPEVKTPKVTSERRKDLVEFQREAGLRFRRIDILDLALCHRSFVNESVHDISDNERLEFLGDSVLGLVVSEHLFRELPDRPEGDLAKIKAHVVSERALAEIALNLGIDRIVHVGRGEEHTGGRTKKALLSDCLEALIGAYYLDAGFDRAADFVLRHLKNSIVAVLADRHQKDYKTLLQELAQKLYRSYPKYTMEKKTGPDHERTYWMSVLVEGHNYGPGSGRNKKTAEQDAARMAYEVLSSDS